MNRKASFLAFSSTVSLFASFASAGLNGSSVSIDTRYPNLATTINTVGPATVTGAVEFPSILSGAWSSDISDTQIALTQLAAINNLGGAAFNGFVYNFSGASTITGVSLNNLSTITPSGLTFTGSTVAINLQGLGNIGPNKSVYVDLTFVPEPASLSAMAFIAPLLRRRR